MSHKPNKITRACILGKLTTDVCLYTNQAKPTKIINNNHIREDTHTKIGFL